MAYCFSNNDCLLAVLSIEIFVTLVAYIIIHVRGSAQAVNFRNKSSLMY